MISATWIKIYAVVFASGLAGALILTPVFRSIAAKTGFMDVPADNHKGHKKSTPLLGGLAMFFSWLFCIAGGVIAVKWNLLPGFSKIAETLPLPAPVGPVSPITSMAAPPFSAHRFGRRRKRFP